MLARFLVGSLLAVVLSGCASTPKVEPITVVFEESVFVLPAGTLVDRPGRSPMYTREDGLLLSRSVVSNMQVRGLLP